MTLFLTDAQFQSVALVVIAAITIIPATLAAVWSRNAKANSAEAKDSSAQALQEVSMNGGMSSVKPNLNDHVVYQTDMMESLIASLMSVDERLTEHILHSQIMDRALAEVYLKVKPGMTLDLDK